MSDASSLKEKGNALFAKDQYKEAAAAYQQALKLLKEGYHETGDDQERDVSSSASSYLEAVCLSNLANCQFEQGDYQQACEGTLLCLSRLDDGPLCEDSRAKGLKQKNLLRLSRARFYLENFQSCQDALEKLKDSCADDKDPYCKRATKMIHQVSYYLEPKKSQAPLERPRLLKPSWCAPVCEYYKFGHDPWMTALRGDERDKADNAARDLHLSDAAPLLSVLMAGINDGRHVLATIMHIREQYEELDEDKKKNTKAILVCNDLNRACMVRFVVILTILYKIGKGARSLKELKEANSDTAKWCTVLQYTLLSYAMPSWCNDMLIQVLKEIRSYPSRAAFETAYPWLPCSSDSDWESTRPILSYWIHQASGYKNDGKNGYPSEWSDISDVPKSLDHDWDFGEEEQEAIMSRMPEHARGTLQKSKDEAKESFRAQVESLKNLSSYEPEMLERMRKENPGMSDEEMVADFVKKLQELPEEEFMARSVGMKRDENIAGVPFAKFFLKATKAVLPPRQYCQGSIFGEVYDLNDAYENATTETAIHAQREKLEELIQKSRIVINKTWKTNPCMYDPLFYSFYFPYNDKSVFSPIQDFANDFSCSQFCKEPFQNPTIQQIDTNSPTMATQFADFTNCSFWNAAHALVTLIEKDVLCLEWNLGDIVSNGQIFRGKHKFHRILASNIPDYTGLLGFFTEIMPMLHEPSEAVTSSLEVNVLLNPPLWHNYAHYVYSSTAVQDLPKAEKMLGMKFWGSPDSTTWASHVWTLAKKETKKASKSELSRWLHQLFLLTILPPERDANKTYLVESCPNAIALFVRTCEFCVQQLGYPLHWISGVLDDLLVCTAKKTLKTKAQVHWTSPTTFQLGNSCSDVNISSFIMDLKTQLAVQAHQGRTALLPMQRGLPPDQVHQYEVCIPVDLSDLGSCHQYGNANRLALVLILEPSKPNSDEGDSMFMSFMPWMGARRRESIRNEILSRGSRNFHLISCQSWELVDFGESNCARFFMAASDFQKCKSHHLSLLRTDGWFRLGDSIQLSKAKIVEPGVSAPTGFGAPTPPAAGSMAQTPPAATFGTPSPAFGGHAAGAFGSA